MKVMVTFNTKQLLRSKIKVMVTFNTKTLLRSKIKVMVTFSTKKLVLLVTIAKPHAFNLCRGVGDHPRPYLVLMHRDLHC